MVALAASGGVRNAKSATRTAATDAADLGVLSHDPRKIPPKQLWKRRALLAVVGGRIVYDKMPAAPSRRQAISRSGQ